MKLGVLTIAAALAVATLAFGSASTAHASHLRVSIAEPMPARVGQTSTLDATVTAAGTGTPVAGVPVTFYAHATFGKVTGFMEVGQAVTDANGVAAVSFVPRETGPHEIRVDYTTPGGGETEETTANVAVDGSPGQLYVQHAGIEVPGLNSWLIILVLSVIWAILLGVGVTVIRVAAAGSPARRVAAIATAPARTHGHSIGSR
jgi:hypothetical protein